MQKTNKQNIQREKQKKEKPEIKRHYFLKMIVSTNTLNISNTVSLLITLASFNYLNLGNHSPEIPNLRQAFP